MKKNYKQYEIIDINVKNNNDYIKVTLPDGNIDMIHPFISANTNYIYDDEGYEFTEENKPYSNICRFCPETTGKYILKIMENDIAISSEEINVTRGSDHGYIEVNGKNHKYFSYTDGTFFLPIGINMAFPEFFFKSNNEEFGKANKLMYLGLRQYEKWFRNCSENNVNLVRLWLSCDYFDFDKNKETYDYSQLNKIDKIISLAHKYNVKLKLTLEQFRYFDYSDNKDYSDVATRNFSKEIYCKNKSCKSTEDWLSEDIWQKRWLDKINELSIRFSHCTDIFAIELWNEMNNISTDDEKIILWNKKMSYQIKKLFPNHMIINSLGSYDSDCSKNFYNEFCWDCFDFKQIHTYLDQGAKYEPVRINPIEAIKFSVNEQIDDRIPFLVAETGAVNDNHSGPFRYYLSDHDGIIFADCVYTPLFLGCCGSGNIWHWDGRYVEAKNLYSMFNPIYKLTKDIDFAEESFVPNDLSDKTMYAFALFGKNHILIYVRNKQASWQNILRDSKNIPHINISLNININIKSVKEYPIWNENITITHDEKNIKLENVKYGTLIKVTI